MSYLVVCLLLNFLVGFLSLMLLVQSTAADQNPYNIVRGSGIYLVVVLFFCLSTTGWSALLASVVGSCGIFWVGEPRAVCRTWGKAIEKFAESPRISRIEVVYWNLLTFGEFLRRQ